MRGVGLALILAIGLPLAACNSGGVGYSSPGYWDQCDNDFGAWGCGRRDNEFFDFSDHRRHRPDPDQPGRDREHPPPPFGGKDT